MHVCSTTDPAARATSSPLTEPRVPSWPGPADAARPPVVAALLVAAGRGRRLGGEIPKQYVLLDEACALRHSVEAFLAVGAVNVVLPVIHADDAALCARAMDGVSDPRALGPVAGGATRAVSVRRGLEALRRHGPDIVLIHDAARPFVPRCVIEGVIAALQTSEGACAALPVIDAIWAAKGGWAGTSVPRDGLWRAQTPQGFAFDRICRAHAEHDGNAADDVAVAREAGIAVRMVQGSERNYKITTSADLERARSELRGGTREDSVVSLDGAARAR